MASRSLGTLTLDLIARTGGFVAGMDQAERSSEKWRRQVEQSMKSAGTAVAGASAATVAALAAMTVSTVNNAKEISRFAAVSGSSVEEFQRMAVGAQQAGIENDKLADIFKDVADKLGDYATTGGGELKDFFDTAAKQAGVTAKSFKGLSGPEALGLFVNTLDKAGASQQQVTFFMESLADDASLLYPLMKNNGEGMKAFADEAQRAGAILSSDTIKQANELGATMFVMENATTGLKNQFTAALIPALGDLAGGFSDAAINGSLAVEMADALTSSMKFLASTAVGVYSSFQLAGKGIGGLAAIAAAVPEGWDEVKQTASVVGNDLDETTLKFAGILEKISNIGEAGKDGASDRIKKLAEFMSQYQGMLKSQGASGIAPASTATKVTEDAGQKRLDNLRQQNAALQAQYDSIDAQTGKVVTLGQEAQALAKWEQELATLKEKKTLTAEQKSVLASADLLTAQYKRNAALEKEVDLRKKAVEEAAKLKAFQDNLNNQLDTTRQDQAGSIAIIGMGSEQAQRFQEMLSIRQQFEQQQNDLLGQYNSGDISKDLYDEETEALSDALQTRLELQQDYYKQLDDAQSDWRNGASEAFADYFDQSTNVAAMSYDAFNTAFSGMNDALYNFVTTGKLSFADLAGEFASTALRMLIQWGTAQVAMAALNAFTSTAAIPIVGPLAAPAAAASALGSAGSFMGMISSVAGMAHDGIDSVPEDGTWLLQKGERVTTAETSAKLDKTLSDIQGKGSSQPNVLINNYSTAQASTRVNESGDLEVLIKELDDRLAGRMHRGQSKTGQMIERLWTGPRKGS